MTNITVLGIETVDYTSKKTNRPVKGTKLHCCFENGNRVDGQSVDSFYISNSVELPTIKLGDEIELLFNRYGSVASINVLD